MDIAIMPDTADRVAVITDIRIRLFSAYSSADELLVYLQTSFSSRCCHMRSSNATDVA